MATTKSAASDPLPFRRPSSDPILSQRPRSSSSSKKPSTLSSALTEDRLRDHTRRAASSSSISPYYKGLTDSGLYFKSVGLSPSRESFTSSQKTFSSSVFIKLLEWGPACFTKNKKKPTKEHDEREDEEPAVERPPMIAKMMPPMYPVVGVAWEHKEAEKPMRESDPAPAQPPPPPVVAPAAAIQPPPVVAPVAVTGRSRSRGRAKGAELTAAKSLKEREYVWAFKYRPKFLKEFICNRSQTEELSEMVSNKECSHFIFEGPPGVGKSTMVLAFLRDAFGPDRLKTQSETRKIELKGEHDTNIDVNVKISSKHVEVNLSELRGYEKHVLVTLINKSHQPSSNTEQCDHTNCRVIVLHEADKLSTDAQHYIRWLMEKYKGCGKIFFCCHDASKLQAIKHLCKIVKLQPPSDGEIVEVLEFIAKQEQIELPRDLAEKIAENSKHNLRQAIRSFEASWKSNHSFKETQEIRTGWEEDIANIGKNIVEEQSPKQLYMIRGKLKNLIEHDVSPDYIFSTLIEELKKLLDDQFKAKVNTLYQDYIIRDKEQNSDAGNSDSRKNIHHFMRIEEFAAKFMSLYKSETTKNV